MNTSSVPTGPHDLSNDPLIYAAIEFCHSREQELQEEIDRALSALRSRL
jgi:hypothetical protein